MDHDPGRPIPFRDHRSLQIDRWGLEGSVLRIERIAPPPCPSIRRRELEAQESTTEAIRGHNPSWDWYGRRYPHTNRRGSPFWQASTDPSGSFESTVGEEVDNPDWDPRNPDSGPPTLLAITLGRRRIRRGRSLPGPGENAEGATFDPNPLVSSTHVWMSVSARSGHPQVVRYSVVAEG